MPNQGINYAQFNPKDFTDPTSSKINRTIRFIYDRLSTLQNEIEAADNGVASNNTKIDQFITNGGNTINNTTITGNDIYIDASLFCGTSGTLTDACINAAIQSATSDGATIYCKSGVWALSAPILIDKPNITILGDGNGTIFQRVATMASGVIQIQEENAKLDSFMIDGAITTYTQVNFSTLFGAMGGDPQHPTLTNNSSVWVSAGMNNFTMTHVKVYRGGGYSVNFDSRTADTENISITECEFEDCISIVYVGSLQYGNYGSWCGGILFQGGGGAGYDGTIYGNYKIKNVVVSNCNFKNITGHGIWAHTYSLTNLHSNFVHNNNTLSDIGRDAILTGGVINGSVCGNTIYRVGYVNGHPMYYQGQYGVGIDTSGYATNLQYVGNSIMCVNGGGMDLDGMSNSTVSGNTIIIPDSTDALYTTDQISAYGYGTSGTCDTSGTAVVRTAGDNFTAGLVGDTFTISGVSYTVATYTDATHITVTPSAGTQTGVVWTAPIGNITKGIQSGNTYDSRGAQNVTVTGNTIKNMGTNSIALVNAQYYFVSSNEIYHIASSYNPVLLACTENNPAYTAPLPRLCKNNVVTNNTIYYNCPPTAGVSSWAIAETDSLGLLPGPNFVSLNKISGDNSGEFLCSATGISNGSETSIIIGPNLTNASTLQANVNYTVIKKEDSGTSASTKFYRRNLDTGSDYLLTTLTDFGYGGTNGPIFNVSKDGTDGGAFATGTRTVFGDFDDYVWTDKYIMDGFSVAARYNLHTATLDAQADALNDDYGLMRYIRTGGSGTGGDMQFSVSTSAGVRVWQSIGVGTLTATEVAYGSASNTITSNSLFTYTAASGTLTNYGTIAAVATVPTLANIVMLVRGTVGQTGDLQQWQDSGANSLLAVQKTGALFFRTSGTPAVVAGTGAIRYDTGTNKLQGSDDGGTTWTNLIGTGSSVAGSDTQIQYNSGGASFGASANLYYDYTNRILYSVAASNAVPAIAASTGYIQAAGGFLTTDTSTDAVNAASGGVTASYLIATVSLTETAVSTGTAGLSGAGQGRIIFDSATNTFKVSENGGAYVAMISSGSPGGSDKYVQYNSSGSFAGVPAFQWDNTNQLLSVYGLTGTVGLAVATSYIQSEEGFYSVSSVYNSIQAPTGGVYARSVKSEKYCHVGNDTAFPPSLTSGDSFQAGAMYFRTTSGVLYLYNGASWYSIDYSSSVVNSINTTATGGVLIVNGSGINVGTSVSTITITNTGATSITGTANQINASASTGAITLSTPQNIDTSCNFQGQNLTASNLVQAGAQFFTLSNSSNAVNASLGGVICQRISVTSNFSPYISLYNAIETGGGINFTGFHGIYMLGTQVIDTGRNIVANSLTSQSYCILNTTSGYYNTAFNTIGGFPYQLRGSGIIDNNAIWVGQGTDCRFAAIGGIGFNYWNGSSYEFGQTASFNPNTLSSMTFKGGVLVGYF